MGGSLATAKKVKFQVPNKEAVMGKDSSSNHEADKLVEGVKLTYSTATQVQDYLKFREKVIMYAGTKWGRQMRLLAQGTETKYVEPKTPPRKASIDDKDIPVELEKYKRGHAK